MNIKYDRELDKFRESDSYVIKVSRYGALSDGLADDTIAVQKAIDAAALKGGVVTFPAGTTICQTLTMKSKVHLRGNGFGTSILKLKDGTNADLIKGEDFDTLTGTDTDGGIDGWSIRFISLDGNSTNNTAGSGIKVFGKNFLIENLTSYSFAEDGVYTEWANIGSDLSVSDQMECLISFCKSHDNLGYGFNIAGPHDGIIQNSVAYHNPSANFYFHANSHGFLGRSCHSWGEYNTYGVVIAQQGVDWSDCMAEVMSGKTSILILAYDAVIGGGKVWSPVSGGKGIQIGDATHDVYGTRVDANFAGLTDGVLDFVGIEGTGTYKLQVYGASGNAIVGNAPNENNAIDIVAINGGQISNYAGYNSAVKRTPGSFVAGGTVEATNFNGSGTNLTGVTKVIETTQTNLVNDAANWTTLLTKVIPANTLVQDGDSLVIKMSGLYAATANTKITTSKIDDKAIGYDISTTANNGVFNIETTLMRDSSSSVRLVQRHEIQGASANTQVSSVSSLDFTSAMNFTFNVLGVTTNDIVLSLSKISVDSIV